MAGSAAQLFRLGAGLHPVPRGALPLLASKNAAHGDKTASDANVRATTHKRAVIRVFGTYGCKRGCCTVLYMYDKRETGKCPGNARGGGGSVPISPRKKKTPIGTE